MIQEVRHQDQIAINVEKVDHVLETVGNVEEEHVHTLEVDRILDLHVLVVERHVKD